MTPALLDLLRAYFAEWGLDAETAAILARATAIALVAALTVVVHFLARRPLLAVLTALIHRSTSTWDDAFVERRVLHKLTHLVPALIIYMLSPVVLQGHPTLIGLTNTGVFIYLILIGLLVFDSFLSAVLDIYRDIGGPWEVSVKTFVQFIKIIAYFVGILFVVSVLIEKSPLYLFSGLGAMTAVLLLVFKDTILGFVAGIMLTVNRMVGRGDWIEMPKYGADGDVIDISLTTVKVQNWDRSITTIPTYALISESFRNWRGMFESGGRRIKRAIYIDIDSIKFCDEEMLERFARIQYITAHIERKKKELAEYNQVHRVDLSSLVNGRRMTNIGTFRAYVTAYLKNHPMIHQDMTFLVRQLPPGEHGLPIEIYVFCKDVAWANYEAIQADLFDHILAIVPEFDLRVFQEPTGRDLRAWRQ